VRVAVLGVGQRAALARPALPGWVELHGLATRPARPLDRLPATLLGQPPAVGVLLSARLLAPLSPCLWLRAAVTSRCGRSFQPRRLK
jgi:hypothetical protein